MSTRCILPWLHQYGDIMGGYGLCCYSMFVDDKFNQFDKGVAPLTAWNNKSIRSARLAMLSNKPVNACKPCYDWEASGIESPRQKNEKRWSAWLNLYDTTAPDGSISTPPIYIDFRFGNLCNFTCRMCGSYASSSWAKEEKLLGKLEKTAPGHYDFWTDNDDFWTDIRKIAPHVKTVYFAGGEPFVQLGHYKMLDMLLDVGNVTCELTYNTNLSYSGKFKSWDVAKLWDQFDNVQVWPSIEGWAERAEYGRKGLDWSKFCENADKFDRYITTFSIVSSAYTITSNLQLIQWVKARHKMIHITNLVSPSHLSTTILSTAKKRQINKQWQAGLNQLKGQLDQYELNNCLDCLKHMNSVDDTHLAGKFKDWNTTLDNSRSESFIDTFPELADWYKTI